MWPFLKNKLDEMNKIKGQHFTFGRPKSERIFESDSRVTTLLSDDSASE